MLHTKIHIHYLTLFNSLLLIVMLCFFVSLSGCASGRWQQASRESAHIAPEPSQHPDALIHVYAADTWGWRGIFAVHTWIAVKAQNADQYTVLEVVGWRSNRGLPVLRIEHDLPDRYWFGNKPELLLEKKGEGTQALIDKIIHFSENYPWANTYTIFPGPNSNTYPAWIAEKVPELGLELPFKAIGSGWL